MRVVHLPFTYFPDNSGGTEVYVHALARGTTAHAIESIVVASGDRDESYVYDGVAVERFALGTAPSLRDSYGIGDPIAAAKFDVILRRLQPDVVHFHAFTMGASLLMAQAAHRRGTPVVFTYHTPTASCIRGTLMDRGSQPCDGVLDIKRCARCALEARGAGRIASHLLGSVPPMVATWIGSGGRTGPAWTALRYTELTELRHAAFRELTQLAAQIVVPCLWARELLVRNGVDESKLQLNRQGLAEYDEKPAPTASVGRGDRSKDGVRLAFLGRLSEEKGAHVAIEALRFLQGIGVFLDVYGSPQGAAGERYRAKLHRLAGDDRRVRFLPPLPSNSVVATLRDYDALIVPSQWMETGPLVVLEAFAAGIPVIGSNLGGISELVTDAVDGLLVMPDAVTSWAETLKFVVEDRDVLTRLRTQITPPRRMRQVVAEMSKLYRQLAPDPHATAPDKSYA